jgi:hypothetical protein
MGLLSDAAGQITDHVSTRDTNRQLLAELDYRCACKRGELD